MPKTVALSRRTFIKLGAVTTLRPLTDFVQNRLPLAIPVEFPQPKFWFGQTVLYEWICDDEIDKENFGKTLWYTGKIRGIIYSHPDLDRFNPQWNYLVDWTGAHPTLIHEVPHFCPEPYAEEELEAV